jgi:hypothetical protein
VASVSRWSRSQERVNFIAAAPFGVGWAGD